MCDMTHSHVTCLLHLWHLHSPVAWLTHVRLDTFTRDMIHSRVAWRIHASHASFIPSQNKNVTRELTQKICLCSHTYTCLPASMHFFIVWLCFPDTGYGCKGYGPYVTWLIHVWHDSLWCNMINSCSTWLIHTWHDSFMCTTRFIHVQHDSCTRDMTHVCVTGLYRVSLTHSYVIRFIHVWHDAFTRDMTHSCVTCLIGVSQTHSYRTCIPTVPTNKQHKSQSKSSFLCVSSSPVLKHTTASIFFLFVEKEKSLMQAGELQYVFGKKIIQKIMSLHPFCFFFNPFFLQRIHLSSF